MQIHPMSFGIGKGRIDGNVTLSPQNERDVKAQIRLDFRQVDVSRLLSATHAFGGAGTVGGAAQIDGSRQLCCGHHGRTATAN